MSEQALSDQEWARMWKMADDRYDDICMSVVRAIADGKGLADVLDLVGQSMDNCDRVDDESLALFQEARSALQPQWQKFDKDDESTWPQEYGSCWIWVPGEGVQLDRWIEEPIADWALWLGSLVSHWMPLLEPKPPRHGVHGPKCVLCFENPNPEAHNRGDS